MVETTQTTGNAGNVSPALAALRERYSASTTPRQDAYKTFDRTLEKTVSSTRLSQTPKTADQNMLETVELYRANKQIQLDLARYLNQYGKLNVSFKTAVGKDALYTKGDVFAIIINSALMRRSKVDEIKVNAAGRKGETIVTLVNYMAETLAELKETAVKGRDLAKRVQTDTIVHMKKMDRTLIERLTSSYVGGSDLEEATSELTKLEKELADFDQITNDYEEKIISAKNANDVNTLKRLTSEVTEVLNMKEDVLDGRRTAEGVVSDIRRKILQSAEGINSAKNAISATKVMYKTNNMWIDSMDQQVFKYEHALSDMVPIFRLEGEQAAGQARALEQVEALLQASEIMERLMQNNAEMGKVLAKNTFELTKKNLIDREKAKELLEDLNQMDAQLNKEKMEWADAQQRISEGS